MHRSSFSMVFWIYRNQLQSMWSRTLPLTCTTLKLWAYPKWERLATGHLRTLIGRSLAYHTRFARLLRRCPTRSLCSPGFGAIGAHGYGGKWSAYLHLVLACAFGGSFLVGGWQIGWKPLFVSLQLVASPVVGVPLSKARCFKHLAFTFRILLKLGFCQDWFLPFLFHKSNFKFNLVILRLQRILRFSRS